MLDGHWMSPIRRGLFDPLFYLRNGSPLRRYWKELEKTQFLPEAELRERQWKRLKDLLQFVWTNNRFYRNRFEKAGTFPDAIRSPADLQRIPLLTKEEIRLNEAQIISNGFAKAELLHFKTGGSTGKALDIHLTEECSELRNACARRHDRWTGWEVGEPIAAVWGNPYLPVGFKDKVKNSLLTPFIYLDTMSVNEQSVRAFAKEWRRVKPTLLYGHAHSLFVLAEYVHKLNLAEVRPKGILSTSMMLMPHERKAIESAFCVRVTDRYGCEEVSLIASECGRHEGMHINIEHLYIEFLREDGSLSACGEPGRIVVTDLMNRAMPFVRYQVEDVGVPTDRKCSCGRGLPLLESVRGRVADFLVKKDGTRVAGVSLIENTLTRLAGIDQMQIIQESLDLIILRIVPGSFFSSEVKAALKAFFADIFGASVAVQIEIVDAIAQESSGKYRFSICRVPSGKQDIA